MQKILSMMTKGPTLRSAADGWSTENGNCAAPNLDKPVGLIPYMHTWLPPTPLHALGEGWKLLSPPTKNEDFPGYYDWWFYKE